MRLVIDANVLISALLTEGIAQQIIRLAIDEHSVFTSSDLIAEVARFVAKDVKIPAERKARVISFLETFATPVKLRGKAPTLCRDPQDNHILHLATNCKAHAIITGDKDLLVLKTHGETRILTPRQFIAANNDGEFGGENFA